MITVLVVRQLVNIFNIPIICRLWYLFSYSAVVHPFLRQLTHFSTTAWQKQLLAIKFNKIFQREARRGKIWIIGHACFPLFYGEADKSINESDVPKHRNSKLFVINYRRPNNSRWSAARGREVAYAQAFSLVTTKLHASEVEIPAVCRLHDMTRSVIVKTGTQRACVTLFQPSCVRVCVCT